MNISKTLTESRAKPEDDGFLVASLCHVLSSYRFCLGSPPPGRRVQPAFDSQRRIASVISES
eukprot:7020195-Pyramimonas_sp.AAC.1